ncbi:MAG: ATP-binding cassette domain-containing protein [Candidatus Tokpelaia sp.]|uniref:ATP-binding cassette domain-containing protein n=1 Tax=Candidatus Tokpelaia sp. TaxID=2233777 RepID=UPI0012386ABA|nr:ATP-binding cassette domain-containing protein [Candidatus Tokpelaia sp.]KAA6204331.1 MAG: ATP-binding cassette domain-containing protein [Candidatus Tokpelaia sp.]KAA6205050.1 MAG: ATP-binding cassette domain-containing protein [Candidatus Tokpelaia sp.]KAA6404574.1 choline ABC transporter ATP-binding protein [Candidatus Tokpelaia sp.]
MASVSIDNVSVVFGKEKKAMDFADNGFSRAEIKQKTGIILGVHDCSLTVEEGQTVVLMGLSGSGKSTLLRTVNGLSCPARGRVVLNHQGQDFCVNSLRPRDLYWVRTHLVSMVFQQFGLLPWRSVADNVGLGLEIAGTGRQKARRLIMQQLELVGLEQWADVPVSELSGGMQQRVGLARAFATGAPVLLMDEPFSALDPLIRSHLQTELLALQHRFKKTILFVSHDLGEAIRMGDKIALMQDGHIVQTGTPKEIVLSPASDHVAEFVQDINRLNFLTAADIMRPYEAEAAKHSFAAIVQAETPLKTLIRLACQKPGVIGVAGKTGLAGFILVDDIIIYLGNTK